MSKGKKQVVEEVKQEIVTPALSPEQLKALFVEITESFPVQVGKAISKKEREETKQFQSRLTYGEIDFDSFALIFSRIKEVHGKPFIGESGEDGMLQRRGGYFYDLGCGTGKPLVAAALLHEFDVCCGIEVLEGLYTAAVEITGLYNAKGRPLLGRSMDAVIEVRYGDFLNLRLKDWRNADVLFANSTCFDDILMTEIGRWVAGLKKGAFVITFTKRVPSPDLHVVEQEMYQMSWGQATVFIQQKITDSRMDPIEG